jgi:hypothetical protein
MTATRSDTASQATPDAPLLFGDGRFPAYSSHLRWRSWRIVNGPLDKCFLQHLPSRARTCDECRHVWPVHTGPTYGLPNTGTRRARYLSALDLRYRMS